MRGFMMKAGQAIAAAGRSVVAKTAAVGGAVVLSAGHAYAAVPAVVGTTITSVQTDALAVADLVWPFLLTLIGVALLMKYAKRFMNKA